MGRRARGEVISRPGKKGTAFQLRFYAYGTRHYVTIGNTSEGWSEHRAQLELDNILADVRRGIWRPDAPAPVAPAPSEDPTFHVFATRWLAARRHELAENTVADYRWQLTDHLLPFFAEHRLTEITVAEVDRYRTHKLDEKRLSPASINKTITRLQQILEVALEYDLIPRNTARGKRRRVKESKPARSYLDRAEQIIALLRAAADLEAEARSDRKLARPAILATLVFGGLRISELVALRWRDVDLAGGRLRVRQSKTDAGVRWVAILPVLHDYLTDHKATARYCSPNAFVFPTTRGGQQNRNNVRNRILHPAVERAGEQLVANGSVPLPEGLTLHALRRTCTSLRLAIGHEVPLVQEQLGHEDPSTTLGIYAKVMRQGGREREHLKALVEGAGWVQMGAEPGASSSSPNRPARVDEQEAPS